MQKAVCRKSSCAGAWQHFSREPDLQAWAQDPDLMHTCELEQVLGVRFCPSAPTESFIGDPPGRGSGVPPPSVCKRNGAKEI